MCLFLGSAICSSADCDAFLHLCSNRDAGKSLANSVSFPYYFPWICLAFANSVDPDQLASEEAN